jgi:hypothetical protein
MGRLIKLKASTLIEGIVAMVIILTCATIAFSALTRQKKGINSAICVQAEVKIVYIVSEAKKTGKILDNTYNFENMRIDMKIINYGKYKNLRVLVCEAYTLQNEMICDYKEIINLKM